MWVFGINGMTMCPYAVVAKLMKFRNQRSIRPELEIKNVTPILKQPDCCQDIVTINIYIYINTVLCTESPCTG